MSWRDQQRFSVLLQKVKIQNDLTDHPSGNQLFFECVVINSVQKSFLKSSLKSYKNDFKSPPSLEVEGGQLAKTVIRQLPSVWQDPKKHEYVRFYLLPRCTVWRDGHSAWRKNCWSQLQMCPLPPDSRSSLIDLDKIKNWFKPVWRSRRKTQAWSSLIERDKQPNWPNS